MGDAIHISKETKSVWSCACRQVSKSTSTWPELAVLMRCSLVATLLPTIVCARRNVDPITPLITLPVAMPMLHVKPKHLRRCMRENAVQIARVSSSRCVPGGRPNTATMTTAFFSTENEWMVPPLWYTVRWDSRRRRVPAPGPAASVLCEKMRWKRSAQPGRGGAPAG